MQYYRCKCGSLQAWSSMGVDPCRECSKCLTTPAQHPDGHKRAEPHKWYESSVDTDEGKKLITRCHWCGVKKINVQDKG